MAQNDPPKRIYGSLLFTIVLTKGRFFEPELFELHVPVWFRMRMINLGDSWSFFGSDFTTQTTRLRLCLIMSSFKWYPNILMVDLHVPYICHIFKYGHTFTLGLCSVLRLILTARLCHVQA